MATLLMASVCFAAEPDFGSIQNEFQEKVIELLARDDVSDADFGTEIMNLADQIFGAHREVMRTEAIKRFHALPPFQRANLSSFAEHESWDLRTLPSMENGMIWLAYGCDLKDLARWAKKTFMVRHVRPQELARFALLEKSCPDKFYRLGDCSSRYSVIRGSSNNNGLLDLETVDDSGGTLPGITGCQLTRSVSRILAVQVSDLTMDFVERNRPHRCCPLLHMPTFGGFSYAMPLPVRFWQD